ncbi:MAG: DUF1592 domain-containing protein [Deltaproteobacteria bacterium]|nr:DUF1592 domain-containing protein [Deltaproteobacteria bacterium]
MKVRCHPWLLALALGCHGSIGDRAVEADTGITEDKPSPEAPETAPERDAGASPEPPLPPFQAAPGTLHRLTARQYRNAVRDLLGAVTPPADLDVDTSLHGFTSVGASQVDVNPRAAELYEAAALDLSGQAFNDAARRVALVGCEPSRADDDCARGFLARFGRRAFRRPLTGEETGRYVGLSLRTATVFNDPWAGLRYAVAGLLQSPHFLYRVELGQGPSEPQGRRYSDFEVASRLSFFLWDSTPDEALLDAAAAGSLGTREGVRGQARRLLQAPAARPAVQHFFAEWLKLERLDTLSRDPGVYPQFTPSLAASMREELLRVVDELVFTRDADLRELFDGRTTFVNPELARLYNLSGVLGPGFERVTFPEGSPRSGVLTSAGFLSLNAHETVTSPTRRGRFVRQFLLCQELRDPPADVPPLPPPGGVPTTLRQRLEVHRTAASCAGCHALMDPLGFAFENFDPIGAYRTTDNGLPVDPRGTFEGAPFRSARELGSLLRRDPRTSACVTRMLYRHATGHRETEGEARVLASLSEAFTRNDHRLRELLVELVASDGFRYAGP